MFNKMTITHRQVFLIDGCGAAVSTLLLVVLACYESVAGMPRDILLKLLPATALFSVYSLACWVTPPRFWWRYLFVIAVANLLYTCLTLFLVLRFYNLLTVVGVFYFIAEMLIIVRLAVWELKIAARKKIA